jgi:hypothetical protein
VSRAAQVRWRRRVRLEEGGYFGWARVDSTGAGGPRCWWWRFLRITSSLQEDTFHEGMSAPRWAGL